MAIETKVDKQIIQGNDYYDLGKYNEAIKCYDRVIDKYLNNKKIAPDYIGALYNKGLALHNLGKYNEAIKCYDKAIDSKPNSVEIWNSKGVSLSGLKKYDEALKCYKKAIEIDPNFSLAWVNQGTIYSYDDKPNEAIKCYDTAIEKDPKNKWAWLYKGIQLHVSGKYNEAIKCYDKAIEKDPNHFEGLTHKGDALFNIGNYSEAESCFNEAIKIDPKNTEALRGLLPIYSDFKHEYDKALQIAQILLEIKPDSDAKSDLAENLIKVGRYEEGREYAFQALNETHAASNKCILRLFILSSYLLENDVANGSKEYAKFFDFYRNLDKDFKIGEEQMYFSGLINVITKSDINLQTKFLLLTIIDLIQGKIDKQKLSFFSEADSM